MIKGIYVATLKFWHPRSLMRTRLSIFIKYICLQLQTKTYKTNANFVPHLTLYITKMTTQVVKNFKGKYLNLSWTTINNVTQTIEIPIPPQGPFTPPHAHASDSCCYFRPPSPPLKSQWDPKLLQHVWTHLFLSAGRKAEVKVVRAIRKFNQFWKENLHVIFMVDIDVNSLTIILCLDILFQRPPDIDPKTSWQSWWN